MKSLKEIVLIGNHNLENEAIIATLKQESFFHIDDEIYGKEQLMDVLTRNQIPDLAIVIVDPADDDHAIIDQFMKWAPEIKILIVAHNKLTADFVAEIKKGVAGYVQHTISRAELVFAIKHILSGNPYISTGLIVRLLDHLPDSGNNGIRQSIELTQREEQLLQLIMDGYSNQEIAYQLFTNKNTILKYRKNLLERTGAASMTNLLRHFIKKGMIC